MQVSILKKHILSAEEFFLGTRSLIVRVTDQNAHMIRFKTTAEADGYGNYIKTRGCSRAARLQLSCPSTWESRGALWDRRGMDALYSTKFNQKDRPVIKG